MASLHSSLIGFLSPPLPPSSHFQVREYDHDPTSVELKRGDQQRLASSQATMAAALLQWCHVSYGEVFSAWMHVSVIRLFTETILRYGLPPAYLVRTFKAH